MAEIAVQNKAVSVSKKIMLSSIVPTLVGVENDDHANQCMHVQFVLQFACFLVVKQLLEREG